MLIKDIEWLGDGERYAELVAADGAKYTLFKNRGESTYDLVTNTPNDYWGVDAVELQCVLFDRGFRLNPDYHHTTTASNHHGGEGDPVA